MHLWDGTLTVNQQDFEQTNKRQKLVESKEAAKPYTSVPPFDNLPEGNKIRSSKTKGRYP